MLYLLLEIEFLYRKIIRSSEFAFSFTYRGHLNFLTKILKHNYIRLQIKSFDQLNNPN